MSERNTDTPSRREVMAGLGSGLIATLFTFSGDASAIGSIEHVTQNWTRSLRSVLNSPVTISDGTLYMGEGNSVTAIGTTDGHRKWTKQLQTGHVEAAPKLNEGTVYASTFRALHAVSKPSGQEEWQFEAGWGGISEPILSDGAIYFIHESKRDRVGSLYSVDANTGELQWQYRLNGQSYSRPSLSEGKVFVCDTDSTIHAVTATTGERVWTATTEGKATGTPGYGDGSVYVADDGGNVYAMDAADGTEQWITNVETAPPAGVRPLVDESALYLAHREGLSAISQTEGNVKWSVSTAERATEPALHGNVAIFGTQSGELIATDTTSGNVQWKLTFHDERIRNAVYRGVVQRPLIGVDDVYLLTNAGNLFAVQLTR